MYRPLLSLLCLLAAAGLEAGPSPASLVETKETHAVEPTAAPTQAPTRAPTQAPTQAPTRAPTQAPTRAPTEAPTEAPTQAPNEAPTEAPTAAPTEGPTEAPVPSGPPSDEIRPPLVVEQDAGASIFSTLSQAFRTQLRSKHYQEVNGLIALLFGSVLVYNGVHFFRLALVFVIGVTIYFTTEDDLAMRFHDTLPENGKPTIWMKVIALELAVLIGSICGDGDDFEGVKKLLGLCLGLSFFSSLQFDLLASETPWIAEMAENDIFSCCFGTLFIVGGFYLMAEGPSYVIAVLAPALGGALVSSSIWYLVSYVSTPAPHDVIYWIDFWTAMNPKYPDMGLIPGELEGVSINRLCSCGSAFLIFAVSAYLQVSWAKAARLEQAEHSHFCRDLKDFFLCIPQGSTGRIARKRTMDSASSVTLA